MLIDDVKNVMDKLKKNSPLIHCITNPISINQCANAVLSVGAKPIMAEHPKEVCEITKTAKALLLNLGNITDVRMESMVLSSKTAREFNIPMVIDLVGIACSELRRTFAIKIIEEYRPNVVKGNYSEIMALYNSRYKSNGVDADKNLDLKSVTDVADSLAKKYNCTVMASGKTDIVADSKVNTHVNLGTPQLSQVTGTGCMLGALTACCLSQKNGLKASVTACIIMNLCGMLAETKKGNGSFMVNLMDKLSAIHTEDILKELRIDEKSGYITVFHN